MNATIAMIALFGLGCGSSTQSDEPATVEDRPAPVATTPAPPAPVKLPDPPPAPGSVRLVVAHSGELLGSEAKAVKAIEKALAGAKGVTLDPAAASEAEAAAVRDYLAGSAPALPAAWRGLETVIAIEVLPPTGVKPKRMSTGLGGIVVLKPPAAEPVYLERADGPAATPLYGDTLGAWLAVLVGGAR